MRSDATMKILCLLIVTICLKCADASSELLSCSFETADLCGFTDAIVNGGTTWTRLNKKTPSTNTGPISDHTTGRGYFMYVEASNHENKKAVLQSPKIGHSGQPRCLIFFVHMFGAIMGTLNVYSGSTQTTALFSLSGNQGNNWRKIKVQLPSSTKRIVFEAIVGASYLSDIAIDDVTVQDGSCAGKTTTEAPTSAPPRGSFKCNFEMGLCGFKHDGSDDFDWTRHKGSTSSQDTGPSTDHTMRNSGGYYMFIETSTPRAKGDTAKLISPKFAAPKGGCLVFYYHMYGASTGELVVSTRVGTTDRKRWSEKGLNINSWTRAEVDLPSGDFQVVFQGVTGTSYQGDIAIDDILMVPIPCTTTTPAPPRTSVSHTTEPSTGVMTPSTVFRSTQFPRTVLFACDFELDFCKGKSSGSLIFKRKQGKSSTSGTTGPVADHTTGTSDGFYAYMDSDKGYNGENAVLKITGVKTESYRCLRFFYHMYGNHVGKLQVYGMDNAAISARTNLFVVQGSQGKSWIMQEVDLASDIAKIYFKATVGGTFASNSEGDIALDDIRVYSGTCFSSVTTSAVTTSAVTTSAVTTSAATITTMQQTLPTVLSGMWSCDFESGICGFTQDSSDEFDWIRNNGTTPSYNTGPSVDHTTGTDKGHYIYIEASRPRRPRERAKINSPLYRTTRGGCLTFYYHMRGDDVGSLTVSVKNSSSNHQLWQRKGNVGNNWMRADTDLPVGAFFIVWTGTIGPSFDGDIAIDDIVVKDLPCSSATTLITSGSTLDTTSTTMNGPSTTLRAFTNINQQTSDQAATFTTELQTTFTHSQTPLLSTTTRNHVTTPTNGVQTKIPPTTETTTRPTTVSSATGSTLTVLITRNHQARMMTSATTLGLTTGTTVSTGDPRLLFACDFEKNTLCNYRQGLDDDFDWTVTSANNQNAFSARPKKDHTTNSESGHYIFIDTQNTEHGQRADLVLPPLPYPNQEKCLKFYINVNAQYAQLFEVLEDRKRIFHLSGQEKKNWQQVAITLSPGNKTITFRAYSPLGNIVYFGEIAVDDVSVRLGKCDNILFQCDFESVTQCGCEQSSKDNFDWTWATGYTNAKNTARPSRDHTLSSTSGHYMFAHSATPSQYSDLLLPDIQTTSPFRCLEYYFFMGPTTGSKLQILMGSTLLAEHTTKDFMQSQWHRFDLDLQDTLSRVTFRAFSPTFLFTDFGEIAIDDVTVTTSPCARRTTVPISSTSTTPYENHVTTAMQQTTETLQTTPKITTRDSITPSFAWFTTSGQLTSTGKGPVTSRSHTLSTSGIVKTSALTLPQTLFTTTTFQRKTTQFAEPITTAETTNSTTQEQKTSSLMTPALTTHQMESRTTFLEETSSVKDTTITYPTTDVSQNIASKAGHRTSTIETSTDSNPLIVTSRVRNITSQLLNTSSNSPTTTASISPTKQQSPLRSTVVLKRTTSYSTDSSTNQTSIKDTATAYATTNVSHHITRKAEHTTTTIETSTDSKPLVTPRSRNVTSQLLSTSSKSPTTTANISPTKDQSSLPSTVVLKMTTNHPKDLTTNQKFSTSVLDSTSKMATQSATEPSKTVFPSKPLTESNSGSEGNSGNQKGGESESGSDILPIAVGAAAGGGGLIVAIVVVIVVMRRRRTGGEGDDQTLTKNMSSDTLKSSSSDSAFNDSQVFANQIYMDISDRSGSDQEAVVSENKLYEGLDGSKV